MSWVMVKKKKEEEKEFLSYAWFCLQHKGDKENIILSYGDLDLYIVKTHSNDV